ncbi:respiratory nitrate reductase subunit gamma [Candidatus Bathyarchaeota archaeon]|nr:respiratory nitrate reductase subunit gamma [Candidatus Bathyarchaeota archaeon]MBS7631322.1 respiratory nitrate reductase subunit gamma [Candidatus Bathyarchaeota archaeon]
MSSIVDFAYQLFVEKLPYATMAVFIFGIILNLRRWYKRPRGNEERHSFLVVPALKYVILDVVLFRKVFKTRKLTWLTLILFHFAAGGIIFGHLRGFKIWSVSMFAPLGEEAVAFIVEILPVYMGYLFIATIIVLLGRRIFLEGKQLESLPNDYIALILLLITSILGQGMRVIPPETVADGVHEIVFIPNLIVLHLEKYPSFHWFYLHTLFTQLFIAYIPYSKLIHIYTGVVSSALYGSRRTRYGI